MTRSNSAGSRAEDPILKIFNEKEFSGNVIKLRAAAKSGNKKPSANWQVRAKQLESQGEKSSPTRSPSSVVTPLDDKDISTFATGRPLQDEPDYKVCKYCKKPIIKTVAADHVRACLKAKAERTKERKKQREEAAAVAAGKDKDGADEDGGDAPKKKGAKKVTKKDVVDACTKGKKRKADEAKLPKEPKAKKKKEKPAKPEPKPKAPVDVEKQCGVQLPNGSLCARSLTCKSHSMGSKRSVLGRSQPYDVLLAAYQKKNQAKQQRAAISASGPPPEEIEANAVPVDSDEETELVMASITRHIPRPFERNIMVPVRKKSQYIRMRELMASALRPVGQPLFNGENSNASGLLGNVIGQKSSSKTFQSSAPPPQRKPLNLPT